MGTRRLLIVVLLPLLSLGACAPSEPLPSGAPEARSAALYWVGRYEVNHPGCRMTRSLELKSDGTYAAVFWQGVLGVDGCGGPFVGDGHSRGTWSERERVVTFFPEVESPQLIVSLRGAKAEPRGDSRMLITSEDEPQELRLTK